MCSEVSTTVVGAAACEALAPAEEPDFASIRVPVLLVTGRDDKISSLAVNDDVFALLPSARLHVIEGIGHRASNIGRRASGIGHQQTLEAPEDVARKLREFLARP